MGQMIDPETILYGDMHQFDPDQEELLAQTEQKYYQGLPMLTMSLTAAEAAEQGTLAKTLHDVQLVVDRMTGWDQVDSDWYANAHDPDHPDWNAWRNEAETERKWRDDTRKRWKIGVLNHAVTGLIWCAHNDEHQEAGQWSSGTSTHVNTQLHLGSLLGDIKMPLIRFKDAGQEGRAGVRHQERVYPPGLRDWFSQFDTDDAQNQLLSIYRLRQRA